MMSTLYSHAHGTIHATSIVPLVHLAATRQRLAASVQRRSFRPAFPRMRTVRKKAAAAAAAAADSVNVGNKLPSSLAVDLLTLAS